MLFDHELFEVLNLLFEVAAVSVVADDTDLVLYILVLDVDKVVVQEVSESYLATRFDGFTDLSFDYFLVL